MRSVTKSRNGCARCKRQKVRCDQTKPACGRCTRVGVECPGYIQPLKWSSKYEKLNIQNGAGSPLPTTPASTLSPKQVAEMDDFFSLHMHGWALPGFMLDETFQPLAGPTAATSPRAPEEPINETILEPDDIADIITTSFAQAPEKRGEIPVPLNHCVTDVSTVLTEFYFKEAASLYSIYDSPMNPFRTTVSQLWDSSRLLHCTLQSMSAACLLDNFPYLAPIGKELRKEAITILKNEQELDHTSLLALLMLGGSSGWHRSDDLGLAFFNIARKRLDQMVSTGKLQKDSNNYHFFEEALIYWELLLAYVADDGALKSVASDANAEQRIYFPSQHIPHPWTGVARDVQITVQEVGRLVRRNRVLARSGQFTSNAHVEELQQSVSAAQKLEAKLLAFVFPDEQDVISPGDRVTPVWHLLNLAEVYRRTGLIQLYRVFPDVLKVRLESEDGLADQSPIASAWFDVSVTPATTKEASNEWLTSYCLETLKMLESIPLESGTRDWQPFLLVSLCSELRLPTPSAVPETQEPFDENELIAGSSSPVEQHSRQDVESVWATRNVNQVTSSPPMLSARSIDVIKARQFVLDRLTSFLRVLPPKPMHVCLNIVKESWSRIDELHTHNKRRGSRRQEVFWMDVMMDNNWETCMA